MTVLRRAFTWLALAGVVLGAVALACRWVDTTLVPVVVAQSALPIVGAGVALLTALLAALRRWRLALVGLAVVVAYAAVGLPALQHSTVASRAGDVTIFSANLEYGRADPASVLAAAHRVDADIVVLVEVTPEALDAFEAAGLGEYPHATGIPLPGAAGLVVRSRLDLVSTDWGDDHQQPWAGSTGKVTLADGRSFVIRGSHPSAPNLHDATRWHDSIAGYEDWVRLRHPEGALIMAGDFNSGFGHPAFRSLADGFTDAHRATGAGWVRTWPMTGPVPAYTQLDHVLVRGFDVVDAGVEQVPGTDHAAVWARVHLR